MNQPYYVVAYNGPFGYIKPWTAVRDGETYSQQFLTPSIVEGMRIKLGVSAILRHRLRHDGISLQQEQVQAPGWKSTKVSTGKALVRDTGVLLRGVMLNPVLHLAFASREDADLAATDHLCLCRNEDVVFPVEVNARLVRSMDDAEFDAIEGFEMLEHDGAGSLPLGINRYSGRPMRGRLLIVGDSAGRQVEP